MPVYIPAEEPTEGGVAGAGRQIQRISRLIDEVADMPLGTQSKILRVLVEQQFTRAGITPQRTPSHRQEFHTAAFKSR